ncbi:transcriptional activator of glycolytic enzymes-domain-containing protein [Xylariomycetidae sp. FL2044]|nr:transcriptional activator of glycolytic enzymes-domain-containing protein [Xylariomycetidae sp. FL2044]
MLPSPSAGITSISPPSTAAATVPTPTSTTTSLPGPAPTPAPAPAAAGASLKRPAAADLQRSAGPNATTPSTKRQAVQATTSGYAPTHRTNPISNPIPSHHQQHQHQHQHPHQLQHHHQHHPHHPPQHHHTLSASSSSSVPPSSALPQPVPQPQPAAAVMSLPTLVTEDQLLGRTPEQLINTILQIQLQHQQYVAHISAQYENITQQLSDLRGSLVASHQAAASALTSRESAVRPIIPPPPLIQPQQQPQPQLAAALPAPRQNVQTTPNRRFPPSSPTSSHPGVPRSGPTPQSTSAPPHYEYRTLGTVDEVWKEYREGIEGQPAVEELDSVWGSRWRPEPRGRTWYSRRKVIWDKIKEYMHEGMDEDEAVREVERLRDGGTINKLIRSLQDERKDRGLGDDSMVT